MIYGSTGTIWTEQEASKWIISDESKPKRQSKAIIQTVVDFYNDMLHYEFLPKDMTLTKEYVVLRYLRETIRHKLPDLLT